MTNLTTFSIRVVFKPVIWFWLLRPVLTTLITTFFKTCVNLEIDTQEFDYIQPDFSHLCKELQKLVLCLQHLCLHLAVLCCQIFNDDFTAHEGIENESEFKHIAASRLHTVLINYNNHFTHEGHSYICDMLAEVPHNMCQNASEFRTALVICLHLLINQSVFFMCHKLLLMNMQLHDNDNQMVYTAYN